MSDTIPSGTLLGGRYRVGALLGQGGMGAVYEGMQEGLERRVALKVLHAHLSNEKELLGRFQREARAVATLGHPNVVQISDFQTNPGEPPFLVMELLQGESLRVLLKRTGPLPPERAAYIFSQVLAALEAAHAKDIVHRDIKPDNIFLSSTSVQADLVKVLDFGVAKLLRDGDQEGKLTQTGFVVGTLSYMAPEQAMGDEVDGRADLYSVGACMYLALTGRKPFDAPTTPALLKAILTETPVPLAALRQDIDLSLASLVDRALQRDPKNRFANAGEMATALAPFARATPHEVTSSEVATLPREAATATAVVRRQPPPTAMTAQLRPGAAAPAAPSLAFSQRTTAVPDEAPATQQAAAPEVFVVTPALPPTPLGPRGPKGTLMSPARAIPPRPATAAPVFTPPPASLRPESLAHASAPPPSFTPAPHAMDAPPVVASTTAPVGVGLTAVLPAPPALTPSPSPVSVPVGAPLASPEPSTTQPAAATWTPPPAAAVPMASAPPFIAHAPAPARRQSRTTVLWVVAALFGAVAVAAIVAGTFLMKQMMATASSAAPLGAASALPSATASGVAATTAHSTVIADETAGDDTAALPALSTSAAPTAVPTAVAAKPKSTAAATRSTSAATDVAAITTAKTSTATPTATATPTPTPTSTPTPTPTSTSTSTLKAPTGGGSHSKKAGGK